MNIRSEENKKLQKLSPPDQVTIMYQHVGNLHKFTSVEVPGMIIVDHDLRRAFDNSIEGIGRHVSLLSQCEVEYTSRIDFAEFQLRIEKTFGTVVSENRVTVRGQLCSNNDEIAQVGA